MNNRKLIGKSLAIGVIILFFTMATVSAVEESNFSSPSNKGDDPIPGLEGIMGENNWYISEVVVSFTYDPKIVKEIHYYTNGWHEYNNPFSVGGDGNHIIDWYWIDEDGKSHDGSPIFFKIDMTSPTIQLTRKIQGNDVTFTANPNDATSGVAYVEFYFDDEYQQTDTSDPYEWTWTGATQHYVYAIAYDNAGNSEKSETLSTPRSIIHRFPILQYFFQWLVNFLSTF